MCIKDIYHIYKSDVSTYDAKIQSEKSKILKAQNHIFCNGPLETPPMGGFSAGKISTVHKNQMLQHRTVARFKFKKSKILQVQDYIVWYGPLETPLRGGSGAGKISTLHINQMFQQHTVTRFKLKKFKILKVQNYITL